MDLKERGIYQLPNGRELVARLSSNNKVFIYNLTASEPGQYELNSEGRLTLNGRLTAWGMGELLYTGRVAPPDVASVLVESVATNGTLLMTQSP